MENSRDPSADGAHLIFKGGEDSTIRNRRLSRFLVRPISAQSYLLIAIVSAIVAFLIFFFMPDDSYSRYKAVSSTDYIKAAWIYERLHFDPTPVDVAFIGSSRTMQGVDSAAVETAINDGSDTKFHVVNLALPSLGRDTPYLMGRMLTETKKPKIVFVEIDYLNFRSPSPIFSQLATPEDFLSGPLLSENLLSDPLLIASRHMKLLWRSLLHGDDRFDPSTYRGQHWDDDYRTTGSDGRTSPPRLEFMDKERFDREATEWAANQRNKVSQYKSWAWAELYYNETYERRLLDLLRQSGAKIVLLYLTSVRSPDRPFQYAYLSQYGDLWPVPTELTSNHIFWVNPTHMNYAGATKFSAWIAKRLRPALTDAP
jgi:hypothetical protein